MGLASRGLQGRLPVPPRLSVGKREWIKIATSRGVCLESLLCAPSHGI